MVDPREFFESLGKAGVSFYTGVPDSLLKDFNAYVIDQRPNHVIAANEGGAVALAAGHYLATGQLALVYMQNSGLGNAVNPLMSLADPAVYSLPMLLLIGWRGEPGKKDEPQHIKQGAITIELIETLGIPYTIIDASTEDIEAVTYAAAAVAMDKSCPFALVVRERTFKAYTLRNEPKTDCSLTREDALQAVLEALDDSTAVVSTTGMASREIFEYRDHLAQGHARDFLTVGSMGHASQIALGIARARPNQEICCLDGDGAVIMHLGAMAIIGSLAPPNFRHVIINNGAHDSVGGQPTAGFAIDFPAIAFACGYQAAVVAQSTDEIARGIRTLVRGRGPTLLEIRVARGNRLDLGRPTTTPAENRALFMEFLCRLKPVAYVGFASILHLGEVLSKYGARRVLLVTGGASYSLSGAEQALRPHLQLREYHRFFEFSENPKLEDVRSGIELYRRVQPDVVVAIGGGSAIDMAKLINVYAAEGVDGKVSAGVPVIAIPTTAGAGSEATQFATVYIDKLKHSISDEALLPNVAIVDPALTRSLPPLVTATSGMDALSQSIESYWCVNSTDESKGYAREAIGLIVPHLREAVHAPADESRLAMAQGAHLAGQAINITRTTAPHALSYALTSRFGVPHGQAVSLTLPAMLDFNYGVTAEDTADPRGAAYVKMTLEDLCACLGCGTVLEASAMLRQLMLDIGLATTFAALKIDKQQAVDVMMREVNTERLVNNPRCLTMEHVLELLGGL